MITITGRNMNIPESEKYIGYTLDNHVETRVFSVPLSYENIDLTSLTFKLDTACDGTSGVVDLPDKTISDTILLTWNVGENELQKAGQLQIQIRAYSATGEKWHSGIGYMIVKNALNSPSAYPSVLPSEFIIMEQSITEKEASAAESATTATTKASEAAQSASDASTYSTNAHTSEVNAKASEDVVKAIEQSLSGTVADAEQATADAIEVAENLESTYAPRLTGVESQLAQITTQKANRDEVTNVMTPKGNIAYASLPTTGNTVGWYYYCPDGDGTHGKGNYVWNGTTWYFGGTGDEGYSKIKGDILHQYSEYTNIATASKSGYLISADSIIIIDGHTYKIIVANKTSSTISSQLYSNSVVKDFGTLNANTTKEYEYKANINEYNVVLRHYMNTSGSVEISVRDTYFDSLEKSIERNTKRIVSISNGQYESVSVDTAGYKTTLDNLVLTSGHTYKLTVNNGGLSQINLDLYDYDDDTHVVLVGYITGTITTMFTPTKNYANAAIRHYCNNTGFTISCSIIDTTIVNIDKKATEMYDLSIANNTMYSPNTASYNTAIDKAYLRFGRIYRISTICNGLPSTTNIDISNDNFSTSVLKIVANGTSSNIFYYKPLQNEYLSIRHYIGTDFGGNIYDEIVDYTDKFEIAFRKENQEIIITKRLNVATSSLVVIGKYLYLFPYVEGNVESQVRKYFISEEGNLYDTNVRIISNVGHQNTVDYRADTDRLITSVYPSNASESDYKVYIFNNASALSEFNISSSVVLDVANIGISVEALNAIWGEKNGGANDIIYLLTRDSIAKKRYITRIQLGTGTKQYTLGAYTVADEGKLNGTFRILKTFERPYQAVNGVIENTNDATYKNGAIYECIISPLQGTSYMKHRFTKFDTAVETDYYLIPWQDSLANRECEGIAFYNNIMFIGDVNGYVSTIRVTDK